MTPPRRMDPPCDRCGIRKTRKRSTCYVCLRLQDRAAFAARTETSGVFTRGDGAPLSQWFAGHEDRIERYAKRAALDLPLFGEEGLQ